MATDRLGVAAFVHIGPAEEDGLVGVGEVYACYARPSAWGTGAADLVLEQGINALVATEVRHVVLWTLAGAGRARRFYEKAGWASTGRTRTHDFGDNRPQVLVEYLRELRD